MAMSSDMTKNKVLRFTGLSKHVTNDSIIACITSHGVEIEEIRRTLRPLINGDVVVELADDAETDRLCLKKQHIDNCKVKVKLEEKHRLGTVAFEINKSLCDLVESDPDILEKLQLEANIDVEFDDNAQTYKLTGPWHCIEWALEYLERKQNASATLNVTNSDDSSDSDEIMHDHDDLIGQLTKEHLSSLVENNPLLQQRMLGLDGNDLSSLIIPDEIDSEKITEMFESVPYQNRSEHREPQQSPQFSDRDLAFDFEIDSLRIFIGRGDIIQESSDTIVSPSTIELTKNFGLSHLIAEKAGPELIKELQQIYNDGKMRQVAEVIHTKAGGELSKKVGSVIHCILPYYIKEEENNSSHLLICAYLNCFHLANNKLWVHSLSIPLFGTGLQNFPLDVSVRSFYHAILIFLSVKDQNRHLHSIRLVNYDENAAGASIMVMRSLLDMDRQNTIEDVLKNFRKNCFKFNHFADMFPIDTNVLGPSQDKKQD